MRLLVKAVSHHAPSVENESRPVKLAEKHGKYTTEQCIERPFMMRNFSRIVATAPFSSRSIIFVIKKKGEHSQAKLSSEAKVDFALSAISTNES
jgi:hypothetical protein